MPYQLCISVFSIRRMSLPSKYKYTCIIPAAIACSCSSNVTEICVRGPIFSENDSVISVLVYKCSQKYRFCTPGVFETQLSGKVVSKGTTRMIWIIGLVMLEISFTLDLLWCSSRCMILIYARFCLICVCSKLLFIAFVFHYFCYSSLLLVLFVLFLEVNFCRCTLYIRVY